MEVSKAARDRSMLDNRSLNILVFGNMGYVGSVLIPYLRANLPQATLTGFDTGWFAGCLIDPLDIPERCLDQQIYGDVRLLAADGNVLARNALLRGVDAVIYLAAISNDPMGERFENPTWEINYAAPLNILRSCLDCGVRNFIFASTCSVYGFNPERVDENSPLNPLTIYAKSKAEAEKQLLSIISSISSISSSHTGDDFNLSILRFGTACGPSPRMRLDLVLNDFVASSMVSGSIRLNSDGDAIRPLIDVRDMARIILSQVLRPEASGPIILNVVSENRRIADLAKVVSVGKNVPVQLGEVHDGRSYQVDHSLCDFLHSAPWYNIFDSSQAVLASLEEAGFHDPDYRSGMYCRLPFLERVDKLTPLLV